MDGHWGWPSLPPGGMLEATLSTDETIASSESSTPLSALTMPPPLSRCKYVWCGQIALSLNRTVSERRLDLHNLL
jgi:hypothetical protein